MFLRKGRIINLGKTMTIPVSVGLTGSMGMGKSTVTKHLRNLGYPVFDADATVHELYAANGKAVPPLHKLCPTAIVDNAVDRKKLMEAIMSDESQTLIRDIEKIVHPLVEEEKILFFEESIRNFLPMVFYDIPLLFETIKKREKAVADGVYDDSMRYQPFDYILTVTADSETQRQRVLSRPGMSEEKFAAIAAKQVPDQYKREHSDFLVFTNFPGFVEARAQVVQAMESILSQKLSTVLSVLNSRPTSDFPGTGVILSQDVVLDVEQQELSALRDFWALAADIAPALHSDQDHFKKQLQITAKEQPLVAHDSIETMTQTIHRLGHSHGLDKDIISKLVECHRDSLKCFKKALRPEARDLIQQLRKSYNRVGLLCDRVLDGTSLLQELPGVDTVFDAREWGTTSDSIVAMLTACVRWKARPDQLTYSTMCQEEAKSNASKIGMNIL